MCLGSAFCASQTRLRFRIFFFFQRMNSKSTVHVLCGRQILLFIHCLHTVHGIHNHFIQKKILKMGPTVLFTHLKIILLQYFSVFSFNFQFSAVSKRTLSVCLACCTVVPQHYGNLVIPVHVYFSFNKTFYRFSLKKKGK